MITKVKPGECHCVNCCNERKAIIEARQKKIADKKYEAEEKKVKFEVSLGGQVRNLHFGRIAVEVFSKYINQEAVESTFPYAVFYGGMYEHNFRKQKEKDYTFKDVTTWVDTLKETKEGLKEVERICKGFAKAPEYLNFLEQMDEMIIKPEQIKNR